MNETLGLVGVPVIVTKKKTSKKQISSLCSVWIETFRKEGISLLEKMSEDQLSMLLTEANHVYRNTSYTIMTDNEYDLIEAYVKRVFPLNKVVVKIGAEVSKTKNKVTLPYVMPSMDKIKPETNALHEWCKEYSGPYVLSCKLDGISGLYSIEGGIPKLYTRGDGKVGQDISHIIPYLRLPKIEKDRKITLRGEIILPKTIFEEKYKTQFSNPRNLVSGIVNRLSVNEKTKDLHFVVYEVIEPIMKPIEQMKFLQMIDVETVQYEVHNHVTNDSLSTLLKTWRNQYPYEMDGVIVTDDRIVKRECVNPKHSFAFKMVLTEQIAESKVIDVIWTPSKDGYLKPRVRIEPIQLGGVNIEYATGFNGAFIEENKIGVGSVIEIIRSGDVIPYIKGVSVCAKVPKMPDVPYVWNKTHIDVLLKDKESDPTVREKNIVGFFRGIEVENLSAGNISRLINAGYDTVPKIISMKVSDFLKIEGFQEKLATKLHDNINKSLENSTLLAIMTSCNIFGRGINEKKIAPILEKFPELLLSPLSFKTKVEQISSIRGMSTQTAELFINEIPRFLEFVKECGLEAKLYNQQPLLSDIVITDHPLSKQKLVLSGFRNTEIQNFLKKVDATVGSAVSKNTFALLVKDKNEETGKVNDAKKYNVPLLTVEEFKTKYML
jgi:DNA ligase (NAD+)